AVDALGQRAGTTRFMTLLAALAVLLGRHARTEEVCVGSPVAGRVRPELEALIGFFVNTLVLRCDLAGDPTVHELLARVRAMTLAAYEHQNVPFEEVVDALAPPRDTSRTPLFQVMFVLQNAPMPALSFHGLTLQPLAVDSGISRFDLLVMLEDGAGALRGSIEYNTDLFDGETIARLAGQYLHLLGELVAHPERRISRLPLLGADERRRLVVEHDRTGTASAAGGCVHELVAAAAARHAGATAVT